MEQNVMAAPIPFYVIVFVVIFAIIIIVASHMIRTNIENKAEKDYHNNMEHIENHKSNAGDPIMMAGNP